MWGASEEWGKLWEAQASYELGWCAAMWHWAAAIQGSLTAHLAHKFSQSCWDLGSLISHIVDQCMQSASLTFAIYLQLLTGVPILCEMQPSHRGCLVLFSELALFLWPFGSPPPKPSAVRLKILCAKIQAGFSSKKLFGVGVALGWGWGAKALFPSTKSVPASSRSTWDLLCTKKKKTKTTFFVLLYSQLKVAKSSGQDWGWLWAADKEKGAFGFSFFFAA